MKTWWSILATSKPILNDHVFFLRLAYSIHIIWYYSSKIFLSQTSFSLYLHNQWTDFYKLSCVRKSHIRAICIYVGYTKATTNDWDIRLLVAIKALSANISWIAEQIYMIKLVLEGAHQSVTNDI